MGGDGIEPPTSCL